MLLATNINIRYSLRSESAPERHLEKLQKESLTANALNSVAPHSCIQHLAKISSEPELFLQKYEELKSRKLVSQCNADVTAFVQRNKKRCILLFRVDLLGPFVQTLELISQDEELKRYLSRSLPRATASSLRDPTITQEDLPKVITYEWVMFLIKFVSIVT